MVSTAPTVTESAKALLDAIEHSYKHRCSRLPGDDTRHIAFGEIERAADALRDALLMADKRAKIELSISDGTKKRVPGYIVAEHFGVHGCRSGSSTYWDVTHLASGRSIKWHGLSFERRDQATAYAEAIAPLLDWGALTTENAGELITDDVREAIRAASDAARSTRAAKP